MGKKLVGTELEFFIVDGNGALAPQAKTIVESLPQSLQEHIKLECSPAMIEVVTPPSNLIETSNSLRFLTSSLIQECEKHNLSLLPLETYAGTISIEPFKKERYLAKQNIVGKDKFDLCGQVCGQHIHFSLSRDVHIRTSQINLLIFLDPAIIALSASSPAHGFTSWRSHTYRNVVHSLIPFQGQLPNYITSFDHYLLQLTQEFELFKAKSGLPPINTSNLSPFNSIWGPIRYNPFLQTVEVRSIGTTPDLNLNIALLALLKGAMNMVELQGHQLNLVSHQTTLNLSLLAMQSGLKHDDVHQFTKSLLEFAMQGLSQEEQVLLAPIQVLLNLRKSPSHLIQETFNATCIKQIRNPNQVNQQIAQKYKESIRNNENIQLFEFSQS